MATSHRGEFGSRLGFILAAAGSAIGLGNIWRFPTVVGENGGAAFVIIYLGFVFLIGLSVMLAEIALGRATGRNPVGAFEAIAPGSAWKFVGGLGVITGIGILSFYGVVAGWTVAYLFRTISGDFTTTLAPEEYGSIFTSLISNSGLNVALLSGFLVVTALVVWRGISGGIEKCTKILMPVLLGLLVLLAIRSVTLEGAGAGLEFYLKPDLSKITTEVVVEALGQAFFSLSLGMGAMLTYGSYISKRDNLASSAGWVCACDTGIALLAGLIIFPVFVAKTGAVGDAGPGLIFVALPQLFPELPFGHFFGIAFFALLAIAALTSTISLLEVPVSFLVDEWKWTRARAVMMVSLLTLFLGVPSAMACGGSMFFSDFFGTGKSFMDIMEIVFINFSLPVGSLFLSLFVVFKWGIPKAIAEVRSSGAAFSAAGLWTILLSFVCPIAVIVVLIQQVMNLLPEG